MVNIPKIKLGIQIMLIGGNASLATCGAIIPPNLPPIELSPTPELRTTVGNISPA